MRILITGGAGFVGSNLAVLFKNKYPSAEIFAFDNLHRRGSELNLKRFAALGIKFIHGDIRQKSDFDVLTGSFDLFLECSAEPSVLAGLDGKPQYTLDTNLMGTLNCLDWSRGRVGSFIFLSTSRVYSVRPLKEIGLKPSLKRFEITDNQQFPGVSEHGVSEVFPTHLPRSLYGATKLASEIILQEYVETYRLNAVINRCGVIAGAGQFGKVDQGVFTYWVVRHLLQRPLAYTGFGGTGLQVRDLLHPRDLFRLIELQLASMPQICGEVFNVGGGMKGSVSLSEYTDLCREITGKTTEIRNDAESSSVDIPLYISDNRKVQNRLGWLPALSPRDIVDDIHNWAVEYRSDLESIFG